MRKILILLVLPLLLLGCDKPSPNWTNEEKANIEHFLKSGDASRKAVRISNVRVSNYGNSVLIEIPPDEAKQIIELTNLALREAKLVSDDVLAKAHPQLPRKFRDLYQKSLELQVINFKTGDFEKEVEAGKLHDLWVDWFNANKKQIKIPK